MGPGFDRDEATKWKASWDRGMVGINPEPLALMYGTMNVQYTPFRPVPKDMAFETSFHWYASLVAACFEISILDISILTRVSTKAAAEQQSEATKHQGLRHIMRKWKQGIERCILPEGMFFIWEDIDPTDEKAMAEVGTADTNMLKSAKEAGFISARQGFDEMQRRKHLDESLEFEGEQLVEGEAGSDAASLQPLVDELDGGGTLVAALDLRGGDEKELAEYLTKAQTSIEDLVIEQAREAKTLEPPSDEYWETSEEYLDELAARAEEGPDA